MSLKDWERDVINRQRNIVFPDTNLNEERRPTKLSTTRFGRAIWREWGLGSTYREAGGNAFYRKGFPPVTAIVAPDT